MLWMLLPMISVLSSSLIAEALGCRVDEGGTYPCVVLGLDIGGWLSTLFVMGWLFFLTVPTGLLALLVLLIVVLVGARARRKAV